MAQDITFILKAKNEAGRAFKRLNSDMKAAGTSADRIKKETREAAKSTAILGDKADRAKKSFGGMQATAIKLAKGLGVMAAAFLSLQTLSTAVNNAREFNAALAETSTLIEGTPAELKQITDASRDFVKQYGGTGASQIKAFYQAISAGVGDVYDATKLLDDANKLAIGGVTDVTTGVDILTTAVNAYGADVITSAEASDSLFVAMKAGKTTIGELASVLGNAIPLANAVGVSFDELNAAVATLTTRGISTNQAVTGIRGVLAAIVKPSEEAKKASEKLGIAFTDVGVRAAGGLLPFLQEVIEKTGGSSAALAELFPGVEGLTPVLALATGGMEKFAEIMEQMGEKAGATDAAFDKVNKSLNQRLVKGLSSIQSSLEQIGQALLVIVVPAVEVFAAALDGLIQIVQELAVPLSAGLGLLAVASAFKIAGGAAGILVAGLGAVRGAVLLLTAVLRANPIVAFVTLAVFAWHKLMGVTFEYQGVTLSVGQVVSKVLSNLGAIFQSIVGVFVGGYETIKSGFSAVAEFFGTTTSDVLESGVGMAMGIVDAVVGMVKAIDVALTDIPSLFELAWKKAFNGVVAIQEKLINKVLDGFRYLFSKIDALAGTNFAGRIGTFGLGAFKFDLSDDAKNLAGDIQKAFESGAGSAKAALEGATVDAINARADAKLIALAAGTGGVPTVDPVVPPGGGTGGGTKGGGGKQTSALKDLVDQLTQSYRDQTEAIGLTGKALEELEIRQQLLAAARRDGIALSEQVVQQVLREKEAYEKALEAADTFINGAKAGWQDFIDSVQSNAEFAASLTVNTFEGLTGAITDLVTTGKADFKGLITDLLTQISRFLANRLVIDFLGLGGNFQNTGGGTMSFLKSIGGALFGGFRADGGPVTANRPYVVGEGGAELFVPKTSGTILPAKQTAQAVGGNTTHVSIQIVTPNPGAFQRSQGQIAAEMSRVIERANTRNN